MVDSKHQWKAWLYLAPAIVLLLVFTAWPIVNTVRMAFLNNYNKMQDLGAKKDAEEQKKTGEVQINEAEAKNTYITLVMNDMTVYLDSTFTSETLNTEENNTNFQKVSIKAKNFVTAHPEELANLPSYVKKDKLPTLVLNGLRDSITKYIEKNPDTVNTADFKSFVLKKLKLFLRNNTNLIGIENFRTVIIYPGFKTCLRNTLLLCVLTVPVSTLLALLIAVALNSIKFLQKGLQTIFFLPYVTNSIAIGMVFACMFNIVGRVIMNNGAIDVDRSILDTTGIVNNIITFFGGTPINWINSGSGYVENMVVMVVYIVWNALPFKILVLLGGLQSINKQYYDAAKVDGTSRKRVFLRITVPLLSPMISYVFITGFIGGFKEYTSIIGIFGDNMGPVDDVGRLNTMVGYVYETLPKSDYGAASAAALILFGIIFIVTMINLAVSKKNTHY